MDNATLPIGGLLRAAPVGQWTSVAIPLRCFRTAGVDMSRIAIPFSFATAGRLTLSISDVRVASAAGPQGRCGQE